MSNRELIDDLLRIGKEDGAYVEMLAAAHALEAHEWRTDMENAPYETPVLTFWPGSKRNAPVITINTKNSGTMLGKRDGWWHSRPDETPTHWKPLDTPPVDAEEGET